MCNWIMDLGATKYKTSCRITFDTHEVIVQCSTHLDDDSIMKRIKMSSIVIEVMVNYKINN